MYFWNKNALIRDLKKGLSEKEKFKYLIACIAIFSFPLLIPYENYNIYDFLTNFLSIVFMIGVAFYSYKLYTGKDFIGSFMSLSLVIAIRSFVYGIIPFIALYLVAHYAFYGNQEIVESSFIDVFMVALYCVFIFYFYRKYFGELKK